MQSRWRNINCVNMRERAPQKRYNFMSYEVIFLHRLVYLLTLFVCLIFDSIKLHRMFSELHPHKLLINELATLASAPETYVFLSQKVIYLYGLWSLHGPLLLLFNFQKYYLISLAVTSIEICRGLKRNLRNRAQIGNGTNYSIKYVYICLICI